MRRLGALVVMAALALAGCGSSSSGSSSPVNTELSYFPSGTPFVMSVQTDPNSDAIKQMHALVAHFPGLNSATYTHAFAGLPQDALVQVFGDLSGVMAQPQLAKARTVPWVAAIRGYATTITASASGLSFTYKVDTTGRSLTADQV